MEEYESFTMFAKFGEIFEKMGSEDRKLLAAAIVEYAYFGTEIKLPYHLELVMIAIKDDIDNSKAKRASGAKGGRPKAKADEEPAAAGDENQAFETEEREVSETEKPRFSEAENLGFAKGETQYSAVQSSTVQSSAEQKSEGAKRKRFAPPARDEAADYAKQIGLPPGEADGFIDHYESNGWKVSGKAPMRDWRASMRQWKRNMDRYGPKSPEREEVGDEYASL